MASRRPRRRLGAATDDPLAIARRALREAKAAIAAGDRIGLRQAANKGYLAVSSAADVAAAGLGLKEPGGTSGRRVVLVKLEKAGRLRRGRLLGTFESVRAVLHGECFHGDVCPPDPAVLGLLDDVQAMTRATVDTLARLRLRRR